MVTRQNMIAVAGSILLMFVTVAAAGSQTQTDPLGLLNQRDTVPIPLLPRTEARHVTPAEEAEGAIIWGPGSEVQAGLSVRLSTRGEHGGRFVFNVYLQNTTDRSLSVVCPSYLGLGPTDVGYITRVQSDPLYCVPIMQDNRGKLVDIGVRKGANERRFTLTPGQRVLISHWTLQTAHNQAQSSNRTGVTEVAHVNPGGYLMRCDVKAEWDGEYSDIRTGKVPFEVLKADME